jgi:uncharacterized cupin superfamily protein
MSGELSARFADLGFVGPLPVLSAGERRRFLQAARNGHARPPIDWGKGHAIRSRAFYDLATHPRILETVAALLGGDVMLWGASIVTRHPGAVHPWHSDVESSAASARTVSVWVGLENTTRDSALLLVPYSHRFGITVQQVRHACGAERAGATIDAVLAWARERDRRSDLVRPEMSDGWAIFFDGRLWHGSENFSRRRRRAVLLQYAAPDTPIRIPDLNDLDWPFRQLEHPRPPCLMLRGRTSSGANHMMSGPPPADPELRTELTSRVHPLEIPLAADARKGWTPHAIFRGATAGLRTLTCHASALLPGQIPHPPHKHEEEELLVVLDGEIDVILPGAPAGDRDHRHRLTPGEFVYYPASFLHTLQTTSGRPASYLMFKWRTDATGAPAPLGFEQRRAFDPAGRDPEHAGGRRLRVLVEGPTAYLRKLQSHASTLAPGAGYPPHVDAYDVAVVVLEGVVETLGQRVAPCGVIFYAAGEAHGMHNPGTTPARYLVFEFHSSQTGMVDRLRSRTPSLLARLTDPRRWKRRIRRALGRAGASR